MRIIRTGTEIKLSVHISIFNAKNELIATEIKAPDEVREQLGYPPVVKNEQIEEFQQEQKQLTEEQQVTEQENKQGFFKRLFRR